jgi:hypothetical protein
LILIRSSIFLQAFKPSTPIPEENESDVFPEPRELLVTPRPPPTITAPPPASVTVSPSVPPLAPPLAPEVQTFVPAAPAKPRTPLFVPSPTSTRHPTPPPVTASTSQKPSDSNIPLSSSLLGALAPQTRTIALEATTLSDEKTRRFTQGQALWYRMLDAYVSSVKVAAETQALRVKQDEQLAQDRRNLIEAAYLVADTSSPGYSVKITNSLVDSLYDEFVASLSTGGPERLNEIVVYETAKMFQIEGLSWTRGALGDLPPPYQYLASNAGRLAKEKDASRYEEFARFIFRKIDERYGTALESENVQGESREGRKDKGKGKEKADDETIIVDSDKET